jgi:transcriptional regulator with XRE-family HTH domain
MSGQKAGQHMASRKGPNSTDVHVGSRVRMRRMMLKMSQEKLGEALGITFQQVQKYEKGMNRISSSRLQQLCDILQVPVAFFFDEGIADKPERDTTALDDLRQFVASHEGLRLIQAFSQIKSDTLRRSIVSLVSELAAEAD